MKLKKYLLVLVLVQALLAPLAAEDPPVTGPSNNEGLVTGLLVVPVATKIVLPLAVSGLSLSQGIAYGPSDLLVALWTVPNAFLLGAVAKGDAEGIRLWRTVNLVVDATFFAAALGLGAYTLTQPSSSGDGWNDWIGMFAFAISVPFGLSAGLDLIPFPAEKRRYSDLP